MEIITDLAVEINENINKNDTRYKGVIVREKIDKISNIKLTSMDITDKDGSKLFNKPEGRYVTIEADRLGTGELVYFERLVAILSQELGEMIDNNLNGNKILVIGLGNRQISCDCLGPNVIDMLSVNSHIENDEFLQISAIAPGVKAQTGLETFDIIKGIVNETDVDLIIAIDALAAQNISRLNNTIQLTDQGIMPGSGVGNHRQGLFKDNLGVPVIAIGVPTVIHVSTIIKDICCGTKNVNMYEVNKRVADIYNDMYVTPKDVDFKVKNVAEIISEAINLLATCYI